VAALVTDVESIDEWRLRLPIAIVLSGAAVLFFRELALEALGAALGGGLLVLVALYLGFHQLGIRVVDRVWPGVSRALATALIVGCVCPPGLPLPLVAALGSAAVLIEGVQRRLVVPLALGGVLLAWPVAWLWHASAGQPLLAPFQLKPLDEPIMLWTRFQLAVDPVRLYTGNVAGALGGTSFGLAALAFLVLAYARRSSWIYLLAFYMPPLAALVATRQPLTVYLLSGEAMLLAGVVAAELRKLPRAWQWHVGSGAVAGAISATLLLRGSGSVAFGAGVVAAAAAVSAFQLFGLAGSPAVVRPQPAPRQAPAVHVAGGLRPGRLALLVLAAPVGLFLLWRDESVPDSQRVTLVALGTLLYATALLGSLAWLWLLRIPN
jgi:hypothetical protein